MSYISHNAFPHDTLPCFNKLSFCLGLLSFFLNKLVKYKTMKPLKWRPQWNPIVSISNLANYIMTILWQITLRWCLCHQKQTPTKCMGEMYCRKSQISPLKVLNSGVAKISVPLTNHDNDLFILLGDTCCTNLVAGQYIYCWYKNVVQFFAH